MSGFKPTVALRQNIDDHINGFSARRLVPEVGRSPEFRAMGYTGGGSVPRPQCRKAMNSMGSGGPART